MIRLKFHTAVRKAKVLIESELRASKYSSLIQIICQNNYIKNLGIGEVDFDGIVVLNHIQEEALKLAENFSKLTESEKFQILVNLVLIYHYINKKKLKKKSSLKICSLNVTRLALYVVFHVMKRIQDNRV